MRIGGERIEEEWEKMEGAIKNAVREVGREVGKKGNRNRGWWDEECEKEKKEVRKELRIWRKKRGGMKGYRRRKLE